MSDGVKVKWYYDKLVDRVFVVMEVIISGLGIDIVEIDEEILGRINFKWFGGLKGVEV